MNIALKIKPFSCTFWVIIGTACLVFWYTCFFLNYDTPENSVVNLKELLAVAIRAAEQGGEAIRSQNVAFHKDVKGKTVEGVEEFITDADRKSHCAIYQTLNINYPNLKIISEEDVSEKLCYEFGYGSRNGNSPFPVSYSSYHLDDVFVPTSDLTVWIDPLDATQEFTENLLQYVSAMICVAIKGQPVIGIIHQPFHSQKITSWGWNPLGVSNDLKSNRHSSLKIDWSSPKILVSRSHAGQVRQFTVQAFPGSEVIAAGGAGYKVLELVRNMASIYLHVTAIKKWDICSGDAILRAAGGRMSTLQNEEIDYSEGTDVKNLDGILASMENHEYLYQKFKSFF